MPAETNNQTTQTSQPQAEGLKKSWFSKHMALGIIFLLAVFAAICSLAYYYQIANKPINLEPVKHDAQGTIPADWKTYRNDEYGFEFKYPAVWKVEDCSEFIYINGNCDSDGPIGGQILLPAYLNHNALESPTSTELIQIGGKRAMKSEGEAYTAGPGNHAGTKLWVIILPEEKMRLTLYEIKPGDFDIYNQILSSFKYIDKIDTSSWKTYRNDEYGFEFKYPKDWKLEESNSNFIRVNSPSTLKEQEQVEIGVPGDFYVIITPNPHNLSIKQFLDGKNGPSYFDRSSSHTERILDDHKAYTFYNVPGDGVDNDITVIPYNNIFLDIGGYAKEGDQILSTFKFIDKSDTSSWKTYRNGQYGFEFKYPESIVVLEDAKNRITVVHQDQLGRMKNEVVSNVAISIVDNPKGLSVSKWWDDYGVDAKVKDYKLERAETKVGAMDALEIYGSEGYLQNTILLANGKRIIKFEIIAGLEETSQILSTFKFLK